MNRQPIISTQQYGDSKVVECRANGSKSVIEPGSNNSAWNTYFDDPIQLKVGDQISVNLGIVNTTSAGQEVIEITNNNNSGLIKLCFYYGDCFPPGPSYTFTGLNPANWQWYKKFRRYQWSENPFNNPVADIDETPFEITENPNFPFQFLLWNNPSPHCNYNYWIDGQFLPGFLGGVNPTLNSCNDLFYRLTDGSGNFIESQPFEAIHTITIPNGLYSPSNLADAINKQIQKTYMNWRQLHQLDGSYSRPTVNQNLFTRDILMTPMNIMSVLVYPEYDGEYDQLDPNNLKASFQHPSAKRMFNLPDPAGNGIQYPGLLPPNERSQTLPYQYWTPPELFGGLFAQFQFNANSGKFEWSNLHTPKRQTDTASGSFTNANNTTTPIFKFSVEDKEKNTDWIRTTNLADGGCGIKLQGSLWETLGFKTATNAEWYNTLTPWNWQGFNLTNFNDWISTYNFTITDPFTSTQFSINNVGEAGNSNAIQFICDSEDSGARPTILAGDKQIKIFMPQPTMNLANFPNSNPPNPKTRGWRDFQWNSTTYQAEDFADKVAGGYYLVQSDILGNDLTYISENGKSLPICGILFKNYSSNDFYFSFNAITPFLVKKERILRNIYIRLLNPDFTQPTNLGNQSCIFFQINSTFQQPIYITTEDPLSVARTQPVVKSEEKTQEKQKLSD